nr:hypothetical protein BHI3_21550 [Bacteriovorax sp. HI3]
MKKQGLLTFLFLTLFALQAGLTPVQAADAASASGFDYKKILGSSAGVLIVSGIGTIYSGILYKNADKQEKESQENIKKIDKMIATFKDSYANHCPNGRDSITEPQCYCYTEAGKQNTNRTNSQTCIDLWAKDTYLLAGDSSGYANEAYTADVAGCILINGQFDENCKCKKLIDAKGNNACKKETTVSIPTETATAGFATSTGLKDLLATTSNAANGNPYLNGLDSASLANKALNARSFSDQMISKIDTSKVGDIPKITEENVGRLAKATFGEGNINKAANSRSMASNIASSRSENSAVESLLKQAQAKVGIEVSGGKGLANGKSEKKKNSLNLNFAEASPGGNGQMVQNFADESDKNYKYKNSDIVTDNTASIFEIISNRYVQSGLKRLFDEEKN